MSLDIGGVISQMEVVSLPILLGYVLHRLGVLGGEFDRKLTTLVLSVALPCTVLSSLSTVDTLPGHGETLRLVLLMAAAMVVSWVVAVAASRIMRVPRAVEGAYRFAMMFGNAGFIGFPVISSVLGDGALLFAVIASVPGNIFMFTVGADMFRTRDLAQPDIEAGHGTGRARKLASALASFKTPTIIASVAALVLVLVGVRDLGVAGSAMSVVGQMSTPAALLIVGSSLAQYNPLEMVGNPRAYFAAVFRLLGIPLACFAVLGLAGVDRMVRSVIVLECAMPVATNGTLYCMQSSMDATPMMQITFLSVVGSILTIPVVSVLLGAC